MKRYLYILAAALPDGFGRNAQKRQELACFFDQFKERARRLRLGQARDAVFGIGRTFQGGHGFGQGGRGACRVGGGAPVSAGRTTLAGMAVNTSAEAPLPVGEVSRLIGGWIDRLGAV